MTPRIVITTGESAGIGPDIILSAAQQHWAAELVCVGSEAVLKDRAKELGMGVELVPFTANQSLQPHRPGSLPFIDVSLPAPCIAGDLCAQNSGQVLAQLEMATELCRSGEVDALVTAPVHKGVINQFGVPFEGHTEFLAKALNVDCVVMMLVAGTLRIGLATTHLPLRNVADAISAQSLERQIRTIRTALQQNFHVKAPRITVLGLNPHAGEGGVLGHEEIEVIEPTLERLRSEGFNLIGPLPADSAFTPAVRSATDAYLAMYHDQGLPVLKSESFNQAVNVSLGLPIIRTSVDHGTALDIAGTGKANSGSLEAAIRLAIELSLGTLTPN